jgi:hypothetical protein
MHKFAIATIWENQTNRTEVEREVTADILKLSDLR